MLYSISQNAKLVLLERVKQEITSKVIVVDIAKKRKRKRETTTTTTTTCGGDGTQKEITSTANTNDNGAPDACPLSDTFAKTIIRSRLIVGVNQCTRVLEKAYEHQQHQKQVKQHTPDKKLTTTTATTTTTEMKSRQPKPSLVLLSKDVLRPPSSILDHIAIYSRHLNIPTLVLPGRASSELGHALGMKCAAVALILSSSSAKKGELLGVDNNDDDDTEEMKNKKEQDEEWKETNQDIDSFVTYAVNKIPKL